MIKICNTYPSVDLEWSVIDYINSSRKCPLLYIAGSKEEIDDLTCECDDLFSLDMASDLPIDERLYSLTSTRTDVAITDAEFRAMDFGVVLTLIDLKYVIIIGKNANPFIPVSIYSDDIRLTISAGWLTVVENENGTTYESVNDGRHYYEGGRLEDLFSYTNKQPVTVLHTSHDGQKCLYPIGWKMLLDALDVVSLAPFDRRSSSIKFLTDLQVPIQYVNIVPSKTTLIDPITVHVD